MSLEARKITDSDITTKGVVACPDVLTGTPAQNKALFDRLVREIVKTDLNAVIDELVGTGAAAQLGFSSTEGIPEDTVQEAIESIYTSTSTGVAKAIVEALKSEGYAVGKQNGVDVTSESPYYHNNAKYYSDNADADATSCSTLKGQCDAVKTACDGVKTECDADALSCASSKTDCDADKVSCDADALSCSSDKTDCDADKVSCDADAASCASDKTSCDASKLVAEGYSVGKQNGVDVTSGSPYYHNNAKYYCEQANTQNKEDKGYLTIGGVQYQLRISTTDAGENGYITFVVEA